MFLIALHNAHSSGLQDSEGGSGRGECPSAHGEVCADGEY